MPNLFTSFLEQVFTHNKFYDCLEPKKFSALFSAINKFYGNVRDIDKPVFNGALRSLLFLNE